MTFKRRGLIGVGTIMCCLVLAITSPVSLQAEEQPASPNEFELYGQAVTAHEQRDELTCKALLEQAVDMGSNHPILLLRLAGACALTGDPGRTLALLEQVEQIGIFAAVDSSDWFTSMRQRTDFQVMAQRLRANAEPIANSQVAFTIPEKELIPEGMAYDAVTGDFFIGSLASSRIMRIDENGTSSVFYESEGPLLPSLGMKVQTAARRLWVCRRAVVDTTAFGVFVYDLNSGEETQKYLLPDQSSTHLLNDLVISETGAVYVTDSDGNCMWTIPHNADTLEPFLPDLPVIYPNGIALSPDENFLYVAHGMGVIRIELASGSFQPLAAAQGVSLVGLDGLYVHRNTLVGVQNGLTPFRVVQFELSDDGTTATSFTILERAHPLFDGIPTTGAIANNRFFYIANSQMRLLGDDVQFPDPDALKDVVILEVGL